MQVPRAKGPASTAGAAHPLRHASLSDAVTLQVVPVAPACWKPPPRPLPSCYYCSRPIIATNIIGSCLLVGALALTPGLLMGPDVATFWVLTPGLLIEPVAANNSRNMCLLGPTPASYHMQ